MDSTNISAGAQNYAQQGIGDLGTLYQIHTTNAAGNPLQENEVGFSFVCCSSKSRSYCYDRNLFYY